MIRKITYALKFPQGAILKSDVKYFLIKKIYKEIKELVCLGNKDCRNCSCIERCIYYRLSGENFREYPSILVGRDFIEKKTYQGNDIVQIDFYMIGIASSYDDFITEYMKSIQYIEKNYFQKFLMSNTIMKEKQIDEGSIQIHLVRDQEDIEKSIRYYNERYNASLGEPIFIEEKKGISKTDQTDYVINGCKIKIYGKNYTFRIKNYSSLLLEVGVGKNAILGGGVGICV